MTVNLSVVIPLYNKQGFIVRALSSVKAQSYAVDEIVVVDDGSTDNSAELVKGFQLDFPKINIRLIKQPNGGVSVARNNGIAAAKNDHCLLLDADDIWLPHFTEEIAKLITDYPEAGLFATGYSFLEDNKVIPAALNAVPKRYGLISNYFSACIKADLPVTASSVGINKKAFSVVGGFVPGMAMGEDQLFWSNIAYRYTIAFSAKISVYYDRSVADSACKTHLITDLAPHISYWVDDLASGRVPKRLQPSLKKLLHYSALYCVKNNLKLARAQQARNQLLSEKLLSKDLYWVVALLLTYMPNRLIQRIL